MNEEPKQQGSSENLTDSLGDEAPKVPVFKPPLQKRHTVTLAMSKSSEKLGKIRPTAATDKPAPPKVIVNYGVYTIQGKRDANEDAHNAVQACPPADPRGRSTIDGETNSNPLKATGDATSPHAVTSNSHLAPTSISVTQQDKEKKDKSERKGSGERRGNSPASDASSGASAGKKEHRHKKEKSKSKGKSPKGALLEPAKDEKRTRKGEFPFPSSPC